VDTSGPIHPRWRNLTCDILAMVARIRHRHHVFVTEDRHFLDRREALIAPGARNVLTPEHTLQRVKSRYRLSVICQSMLSLPPRGSIITT